MTAKKVLVTGANGFIGSTLVRRLVAMGHRVSCLVRSSAKADGFRRLNVKLHIGTISDAAVLQEAAEDTDWVFHLAGTVNFLSAAETIKINTGGTENLLSVCASKPIPPITVLVSSLAAVGPSPRKSPHVESVTPRPVSNYGQSKFKAEQIAEKYADRVPISIVRPPIVLGSNDTQSQLLFRLIDQWRFHLIPGYIPQYLSVIHVDDLVEALLAVAERGQRITSQMTGQGIYFAAADELVTFGELGRRIGQAQGKSWIFLIPTPKFSVSLAGMLNSTLNRLFKTKLFLTIDKSREARAGSWTCSSEKLKQETGWHPAASLQRRLEQTAEQLRAPSGNFVSDQTARE